MLKKIRLKTAKSVICGIADLEKTPADFIASLRNSWKQPRGRILKQGNSTVAFAEKNLFIKCSPAGKFLRAFRKTFQKSRAMRSAEMALLLHSFGISTPEVYCAVREKHLGLPVCDYLVTSELDIAEIKFACKRDCLTDNEKQELLEKGARLLGFLHAKGIIHGDASMRNFYIESSGNDWRLGVIDLDGCKKIPAFLQRRAFLRETARFLSSYSICLQMEQLDAIRNSSNMFFNIYNTVSPLKLYPECVEKRILEFLKTTRRK